MYKYVYFISINGMNLNSPFSLNKHFIDIFSSQRSAVVAEHFILWKCLNLLNYLVDI